MSRNFRALLEAQWAKGKFVCVGLDTDVNKLPKIVQTQNLTDSMITFNREIIGATKDLVCAFKPNSAFYEKHGADGWGVLHKTCCMIREYAPDVPIIWDAKRADIGNTNEGYVEAFLKLKADALTVNPYLGAEALKPFLDLTDSGIIVLCRTSNPGAGEFQDLIVETNWEPIGRTPLYQYVARQIARVWNENDNCAVVVGATCPDELQRIRELVGDLPILIPGIGAQGGDLEKTVRAGKDSRGRGMIINLSRSVLYASSGDNFAQAARCEVERVHNLINSLLREEVVV